MKLPPSIFTQTQKSDMPRKQANFTDPTALSGKKSRRKNMKLFIKIINSLSYKPNYILYYRETMEGDGVILFLQWKALDSKDKHVKPISITVHKYINWHNLFTELIIKHEIYELIVKAELHEIDE